MPSLLLLLFHLLYWTQRTIATLVQDDDLTDRSFLPSQDWSVDTNDLKHLIPSFTSKLMFLEQPRTSLAMSTTMDMIFPAVLLENSALIATVRCTPDHQNIAIKLATLEAFQRVMEWPDKDLVLITNRLSCNGPSERGVYLSRQNTWNPDTLSLQIQAKEVSWKDVAKTMTIDYLGTESQSVQDAEEIRQTQDEVVHEDL